MDLFKDRLNTLDASYLRPRYSGYLYFQDHAGDYIQDYVMNGGNVDDTLNKLQQLYETSRKERS